ncbi:MAG: hypothetical protein ACE14M_02095 [Terriglobales bacterium]
MKTVITTALVVLFALFAGAQVASPPPMQPSTAPATTAITPPAPSFSNVVSLLSELERTAQAVNVDTARLRIEKWKTSSTAKRQAQDNVDSVQRNITAALPGMIQQLRSDPQSMAAGFKLYRNLNALYDVLAGVTESAGASGPKEEFQALAADVNRLDNIRRALGADLENLATYKDSELVRLRNQLVQARSTAAPSKKIVDDNEPAKKPKKKAAQKGKTASTATPPKKTSE